MTLPHPNAMIVNSAEPLEYDVKRDGPFLDVKPGDLCRWQSSANDWSDWFIVAAVQPGRVTTFSCYGTFVLMSGVPAVAKRRDQPTYGATIEG